MKIIISPAKKMNINTDDLAVTGLPVFVKDAEQIMKWVRKLSFEEKKKLWGCNEKIARQNEERFADMDLYNHLTPAILSYEGIQYQYMAPAVFEREQLDYIQAHLYILSGFYGVLKPMDGVTPYRLEMQAKAKISGTKDLYEYWKDRLYKTVLDEDRLIVNLASKEYSKCIETYLTPEDRLITCVFADYADGKETQKGTYAKMARGEMVRFMAEQGIENPLEMKKFCRLGYVFREELSTENRYVFIRTDSRQKTDIK